MATTLPTVKLNLLKCDGNAFFLMGSFSRAAKKAKWPQVEIDKVLKECMSGDYDNLLRTLLRNTKGTR